MLSESPIAKSIYEGTLTAKMVDYFTGIVKKSIAQTISEQITGRLKTALVQEEQAIPVAAEALATVDEKSGPVVITTAEELEAFYIVRSILRPYVEYHRIVHRDAQSYFAILLDDNNRKPICRLHFNGQKKYIGIIDSEKKETRFELQSLDDIYNHSEALQQTILSYTKLGVKAE